MNTSIVTLRKKNVTSVRGSGIKLSEFSERTGIPLPKIRRHAKEVLGPDPFAKRRSGYARYCDKYECLLIYLSCKLIRYFETFEKTREVLKTIPDDMSGRWDIPVNECYTLSIPLNRILARYIR